jgi:hypothetical protein
MREEESGARRGADIYVYNQLNKSYLVMGEEPTERPKAEGQRTTGPGGTSRVKKIHPEDEVQAEGAMKRNPRNHPKDEASAGNSSAC